MIPHTQLHNLFFFFFYRIHFPPSAKRVVIDFRWIAQQGEKITGSGLFDKTHVAAKYAASFIVL